MLSLPQSRGSVYLTSEESALSRTTPRYRVILPLILSVLLLGSLLSLGVAEEDYVRVTQAIECDDAGEECDKETLESAMSNGGYDSTDEGFDEIMDKVDSADSIPDDSILYAFKRHFTPGYMNEGDKAYVAGSLDWYNNIFEARGKTNCGTGWQAAAPPFYPGEENGDLFWHNCDVPNLITEFFQDMASLFITQGIQGATVRNVKTSNPWFGYAWTMPDEIVRNGQDNVTALEVFGYNLRYTSYKGEWDHIKVMTAARALTNFGFLDRLKLSAQAVLNGILGGVDAAVNTLLDDLKSGNIVRIITSPQRVIASLFGGGVSSVVDTVIDTSDTNVFATNAWYRPNFGATLYNARQLSQEEIAVYVERQFIKYLNEKSSELKDAPPPADLLPLDPDKLDDLKLPTPGRCAATYTASKPAEVDEDGKETSPADTQTGSVPNNTDATEDRQACVNYVNSTAQAAYPDYTIAIDELDFEQRKTVQEWSDEAAWQDPVEKYQVLCKLDLSNPSSTDPEPVLEFLSCLREPEIGYKAAVDRETRNEQTQLNIDWFTKYISEKQLSEYFRKQAALFTSASARYVCVDSNGNTMREDDGDYVRLIVGSGPDGFPTSGADQRFNPACEPVRKPIQNGLFGNGYLNNSQPPVDTRREAFGFSIWDLLYQDELFANTGLAITVFTTRMSNTFLNLAFSPILEAAGLETIIVSIILALRDSLFFPLAIIVIAIAAIRAFFSAGKNQDYGAQLRTLLIMAGLFVFGTVLLISPARTLNFVDEAPAQVEAVIVGSIFEVDNERENNLCNAGEASPSGTGPWGNQITFNPEASVRNLLCENWAVFAFRPYVYGQWGTNYENLNYEVFQATGEQATLVGDGQGSNPPYVGLGNGGTNSERNWALYQLDLINAGTVTTEDPILGYGNTGSIYRLVDLQAGPNGNASDAPYADQYFKFWAGDDMGARVYITWLSAIMSVVGMITIFFFAWAKIFISLMSMLMVMFLPIMLLIGLFPGAGTFKLKGYFLQLVSLMVQRVILAVMIALMLRIITSMSQSTESYFLYFLITTITCIAFLIYRKEMLSVFDKSIVGNSGGFAQNMKGQVLENIPGGRSAQQMLNRGTTMASGLAYGAVGGFASGGFAGARAAAGQVRDRNMAMLSYKQAQSGLGSGLIAKGAFNAGKGVAESKSTEFLEERIRPSLEAKARSEIMEETGLNEEQIDERDVIKRAESQLEALRPANSPRIRKRTSSRKTVKSLNELRRAEDNLFEKDELRADKLRSFISESERLAYEDPEQALEREKLAGIAARPVKKDDPKADKQYEEALERATSEVGKRIQALNPGETIREKASQDVVRNKEEEEKAQARREVLRLSAQAIAQSFREESLNAISDRVGPDDSQFDSPDRTNHGE